jgi:protein gp37
MAETTEISWSDATICFWIGCSRKSPACTNCFADRDWGEDSRFNRAKWGVHGTRSATKPSSWRKLYKWDREAKASGIRKRVFVNSLSDTFEEWDGLMLDHRGHTLWINHDDGQIAATGEFKPFDTKTAVLRYLTMNDIRKQMFKIIDETPNLDYLLLTKRPENILKMWPERAGLQSQWVGENDTFDGKNVYVHRPNCWIGTTVENQEYADKRVPELLKCRDLAPVLFLSCEPLLGSVDLGQAVGYNPEHGGYFDPMKPRINWCIVGGESGPNARPSHPDWFRSLRDQCQAAGVSYHFKQWGEWAPIENHHVMVPRSEGGNYGLTPSGEKINEGETRPIHVWHYSEAGNDDSFSSVRVGTKKSGRLLDGALHDAFPKVGS